MIVCLISQVFLLRGHLKPYLKVSGSLPTLPSRVATASTTSLSPSTLVHRLFEGTLTSETRCLTCETASPVSGVSGNDLHGAQVSSRDESFLDLSIDIEKNASVTACLRQFSASEMLCHRNKFFCDSCCDLQEAEKRSVSQVSYMVLSDMPSTLTQNEDQEIAKHTCSSSKTLQVPRRPPKIHQAGISCCISL
jgi:hypothetical protein